MADRFIKSILFRDVCPGDTVLSDEGKCYTIVKIERMLGDDVSEEYEKLELFTGGSEWLVGGMNAPIRLVHRPWPEGKTESDILRDIIGMMCAALHASSPDDLRNKILVVAELVEIYELGLPLELEKK